MGVGTSAIYTNVLFYAVFHYSMVCRFSDTTVVVGGLTVLQIAYRCLLVVALLWGTFGHTPDLHEYL